MSSATPSAPNGPTRPRHLRLLATLWLPAAVLVGLTALGAARTAVLSLVGLLTQPRVAPSASVAVLLISAFATVVLARITWRLVVEVPRTLRAWRVALAERQEARLG